MEVLKMSDFKEKSKKYSKNIIDSKDFTIPWLQRDIMQVDKNEYANIAESIRSVGNSKIQSVDLENLSYTVDDQKLSLVYLSSGEFIFLLGEVSRINKHQVILVNLMSQLSTRNIEKFTRKYKDCDIIMVFDDGKEEDYENVLEYGVM